MSAPPTAVSEIVEDLWEAGRAAWPTVPLPAGAFASYLQERTGAEADLASLRASGNGVDLYLACACALGMPAALAVFDRVFLARVPEFVRRIDASPTFGDDVRQALREKLFVASPTGTKIADYRGRGSLVGWLRIAALRTALNLVEERHPERRKTLDDATQAIAAEGDVELEYLKTRYRGVFETVVRTQVAELGSDERRVLRLHLVGGLTTRQIGILLGVHQSTVVRSLHASRHKLRDEVQVALRQRLQLSPSEFESLAALVVSRLDLSLGSVLRESSAQDPD